MSQNYLVELYWAIFNSRKFKKCPGKCLVELFWTLFNSTMFKKCPRTILLKYIEQYSVQQSSKTVPELSYWTILNHIHFNNVQYVFQNYLIELYWTSVLELLFQKFIEWMLNVLICSKLFTTVHEVLNNISQGLVLCRDTLQIKNFVEIALSSTVFEI